VVNDYAEGAGRQGRWPVQVTTADSQNIAYYQSDESRSWMLPPPRTAARRTVLLLNGFTPPTALPIITVTCITVVPCSAWYPSTCAAGARVVPAVALLSAVQNLPAAFAAASSHALLLPLGVVTGKKFNECPDHLMELSMRVNAEAHFWTTQAVLPKMI
jgi:hypothetical protein